MARHFLPSSPLLTGVGNDPCQRVEQDVDQRLVERLGLVGRRHDRYAPASPSLPAARPTLYTSSITSSSVGSRGSVPKSGTEPRSSTSGSRAIHTLAAPSTTLRASPSAHSS